MGRCIQGHSAAYEGARFCVECGSPILQPCPYGPHGENELVPLLTDGRPTHLCPVCRKYFSVCRSCGRLHRLDESTCRTQECQHAQLLAACRLEDSALCGPGQTGCHHVRFGWSSNFEPREPVKGQGVARALCCVAGIIVVMGEPPARPPFLRFFDEKGATIYAESTLGPLSDRCQDPLVAAGGQLFALTQSSVYVVDAASGAQLLSVPYSCIGQTATSSTWIGIQSDGEKTVLLRQSLPWHGEPVKIVLDEDANTVLPVVALPKSSCFLVGTREGSVYRVEDCEARFLERYDGERLVRLASLDDGSFVLLSHRGRSAVIRVLRLEGSSLHEMKAREIDDLSAPASQLCTDGKVLYIADGAGQLVYRFELPSLAVPVRLHCPGRGELGLIRFAGVPYPFVAVGESGDTRGSRFLFCDKQVDNGAFGAQIGHFQRRPCRLVASESALVTVQHYSGQYSVQIHEPQGV